MKRAFTMLELVFVIILVGIISVLMLPSFDRNNLREAADQIVSHIRYTQHLAMMDDKFIPNSDMSNEPFGIVTCNGVSMSRKDCHAMYWYRGRWQIHFANTLASGYKWSYMIYSDGVGFTGTPDISEHAKNPLDGTKYLSGGYSAGNIDANSPLATRELNLGNEYGIADVDFTDGCSIATTRQRISFDYLGRPMYGNPHAQTLAYKDELNFKILKSTCHIELCLTSPCSAAISTEKITIAIEPETGYTHILN